MWEWYFFCFAQTSPLFCRLTISFALTVWEYCFFFFCHVCLLQLALRSSPNLPACILRPVPPHTGPSRLIELPSTRNDSLFARLSGNPAPVKILKWPDKGWRQQRVPARRSCPPLLSSLVLFHRNRCVSRNSRKMFTETRHGAAVGGNVRVTSDSSPSSLFMCGISLWAQTSFTLGVLRPEGGSQFIRAVFRGLEQEKECYVFWWQLALVG